MSYVDSAEAARRERKLGSVVGGIAVACMLGVPLLGWLGAFAATWWMCVKAFINSPRRLADISLCVLGLVIYLAIVTLTIGNIGEHFVRMWLPATLWSGFWVWAANKRFPLLD